MNTNKPEQKRLLIEMMKEDEKSGMYETKLYIVTAYRWGHRQNHSYNIAVFTDKDKAIECAESHTSYRGGKYGVAVEEIILNQYDEDAQDYTNEIFKTKSLLDQQHERK